MRAQGRATAVVLVGLGLALFPIIGNTYLARILTFTFMYAVLASAWNLIGGFGGYASFGNVVFFGVGAYSTAIAVSSLHWPLVIGLMAGAIVSTLLSILVVPVLRLKGHYFAIATLAVSEAVRELISNAGFTGGGTGMSLPILPGGVQAGMRFFYWLMMGLMLLALAISAMFRKLPIGYALLAIKSDEETAESLGIDTNKYKGIAWFTSAALTALVGGVYAYWITFIDPVSVFLVDISVTMIIMVLLGGTGTVFGPIIGAFLLEIVSEFTWNEFLELHTAVLGLIMVLFIIFLPGGLTTSFQGGKPSWRVLTNHLRRYSV